MSMIVRQSTARTILVGPILDSTGAAVTTVAVDKVKISKNGAALAALDASATLTHAAAGKYLLALTANDWDTVGVTQIALSDGTNDMPVVSANVIEEAVFDALFAASAAGYQVPIWASAASVVNLSNTTVKTLTDAPADSSGTTTLLSRVSAARAGYLDNLSAGAVALEATLTAMKGATFDGSTDSLEALRNRGDAAWTTATGFATSAALTTVEGKIDTIDTVVDTILGQTGTTGVKLATDALDAAAIATTAVDEIAAAVGALTMTELASIPAASPTLKQAVALLYMALRNKRDTDSTGGTDEIHNDAGTVIGTAAVTDSGTLFSKGKYA